MKYNFQKRGFTLIETMVAVTILTLAVAGPLVTADRAVVAAQISHDQLIASYLAQEGVEYVHQVRDDAYLQEYYQVGGTGVSAAAWANFLSTMTNCRGTTNVCTLDPARTMGVGSGLSLVQCVVGSCTPSPLYLTASGYNQQSNGTPTSFTRTVQLIDVSATDERVVSKVSWSFHSIPYTATITDHLTPWQ